MFIVFNLVFSSSSLDLLDGKIYWLDSSGEAYQSNLAGCIHFFSINEVCIRLEFIKRIKS